MRDAVEFVVSEVRSAWRFRWVAIIAAWFLCLLGWILVMLIPGRYDTATRVYVDTTSVLRPLLEGLAVAPRTASEVEMVKRVLLARPRLERVIDETPLKLRAGTDLERASLLNELASSVRITGDPQSHLYTIVYGDHEPTVSYEVVQNLLDAFLGQTAGENRSDAESAQKFLEAQLAEYEKRLSDSERKLAAFKKHNVGFMPDDRGGYFERLQREMQEVDRLQAERTVALNKRRELRAKLLGGEGEATGPSSVETSADTQIAEARVRLQNLLLQYTDEHPDVVALRETIVALEAQRTQEIEALRSNSVALGSSRSATSSIVVQNLQIALNEAELTIAAADSQLAGHRAKIAELNGMMNVLPEVEAELARLTRDYGSNQTQYQQLLQRLDSARLTDEADRNEDLKIKVIEPPVLPVFPASPKRGLLVLAVLFGGLGAAGGIAWLLAQLRPVFSNLRELKKALNLPVLGSVSQQVEEGNSGIRNWLSLGGYAAAVSALVLLCAILFLVHNQVAEFSQALIGHAVR